MAGEIKKPKSYSLRTLEILKNMTKEDLILLEKYTYMAFSILGIIYNDEEAIGREACYEELVFLEEAGLLSMNVMWHCNPVKKEIYHRLGKFLFIKIVPTSTNSQGNIFKCLIYAFTKAGKELIKLLPEDYCNIEEYACNIVNHIKKYNIGFNITLHRIVNKNCGENEYETMSLI